MLTRRRQPLQTSDALAVARALAADPVATCMVAARVESYGIEPRWLGGQLWSADDPEFSLCFSGANPIPLVGADAVSTTLRSPRRPARAVLVHRRPAEAGAGAVRNGSSRQGLGPQVRAVQPLMALRRAPRIAEPRGPVGHPRRPVGPTSPRRWRCSPPRSASTRVPSTVGAHRQRLAGLIDAGRVFARFDDGRVVFKAEIGCALARGRPNPGRVGRPRYRDSGLGKAGTAAVAAAIRAHGRTPSLYVNDFNVCARAHEAVGFEQVGTFATVLID